MVPTERTETMVPPDPEEPLLDEVLADEIALLGDVMAAVAAADRALTDAEVDAALGLASPEPREIGSPQQD
jgi:hypothetical protein